MHLCQRIKLTKYEFKRHQKKIGTVENVKKITNAMQMVSAVKMKKAQKAALEGRLYRTMLDQIMQRIFANTSDLASLSIPWLKETEGTRDLYILITSNKGLCGSFHTNLFKHVFAHIEGQSASDFITIGKKGADFVTLTRREVVADFSDEDLSDSVSPVFALIQEKFLSGSYRAIYVVYNKFISSLKSEPTTMQLLPVRDLAPLEVNTTSTHMQSHADYLIEPSVEQLLGPLVEDYLKEKIRGALADSEASEHSARMLAMKNATDSAGEIVHSLTLLRNKIRQSQITNELLDMIAAKESTDVN
ncbi:MAG: ATP synthase gamma chain [Microgenomates bacterium OLB23]|nr:MAG: ATP synthase gamma chain [Microgenomates bacterium OLB23]